MRGAVSLDVPPRLHAGSGDETAAPSLRPAVPWGEPEVAGHLAGTRGSSKRAASPPSRVHARYILLT